MKINGILLGILVNLILIVGLFAAYIVFENVANYKKPYLFTSVFVVLGIWIGIKVSNRINKNNDVSYDYKLPLFLSMGFIGLLIYFGTILNEKISESTNYKVIVKSKHYTHGMRGNPGIYSLYFYIDEERKRLVCGEDFGEMVNVGNEIDVCIHKSKVGFHFLSLKKSE